MARLLVGLDGSELAEAAIPYAEMFARASHATIVLVHVMSADEVPTGPLDVGPLPNPAVGQSTESETTGDATERLRALFRAERYLNAVATRLRADGLAVETAVDVGDPATVLVEEAGLCRADMLILSTHGRSGLGRLLRGSVADRVLRTADVPVLLVPPACQINRSGDRASSGLAAVVG
jgi:nucleotide-binding universal stress UspA family protein